MATIEGVEVTPLALAKARDLSEQYDRDALRERHIEAALQEHADHHSRTAADYERSAAKYRDWLAKATACPRCHGTQRDGLGEDCDLCGGRESTDG